nr:uncharacterized protein K02A2.6-like [Halyomorpha halys]
MHSQQYSRSRDPGNMPCHNAKLSFNYFRMSTISIKYPSPMLPMAYEVKIISVVATKLAVGILGTQPCPVHIMLDDLAQCSNQLVPLLLGHAQKVSVNSKQISMPLILTRSLCKYATILSGFDYVIKHKKAVENVHVDYFSWAPMLAKLPALDVDDIIQQQSINQISTDLISAKSIAVATRKDCQLSKLLQQLHNDEVQDEKFSLQDGVIFKGHRVYIPPALQPAVLAELHSTHIKTSKMKSLARRYCFWTNIDRDIEAFVKSCKACASTTCAPSSAPIHPWEEPTSNVQRVHIDYAGPKDGHYLFILIDAKSKWPEV